MGVGRQYAVVVLGEEAVRWAQGEGGGRSHRQGHRRLGLGEGRQHSEGHCRLRGAQGGVVGEGAKMLSTINYQTYKKGKENQNSTCDL